MLAICALASEMGFPFLANPDISIKTIKTSPQLFRMTVRLDPLSSIWILRIHQNLQILQYQSSDTGHDRFKCRIYGSR